MRPNFIDNPSFKNLIKEKEVQIHQRTNNDFLEHDNFKKVHRLLVSFNEENILNEFKAIIVLKDDVLNIADDIQDKINIELNKDLAIMNNHIVVDKDFKLLNCERKIIPDNNDARRLYLEISKEFCVFLLTPKGVHYFVDNIDAGEAIFFTPEALNSYNELKDISKIFELFDEYRFHLTKLDTFRKFFVTKSSKKSLFTHLKNAGLNSVTEEEFLDQHIQLLKNTPEDSFREDLRHFLEGKLKAQLLGKEYVMENFRRLDIFIQDDFGDLYLIEVKWVGLSIHRDGQKLGTSYSADDINPDAVLQSVNYIKQLADENKKIKIGYLAVFDARYEELPDTVETFDESVIPTDNEKYYTRFRKIKDFRVINLQPNLI